MSIKITYVKKLASVAISTAIASGLLHSSVHASGFALIEFGGSGMGNAFAGAAAVAEDATTVQFNPAGMALLERDQIVGALHFIIPNADYVEQNSTIFDNVTPLTGNPDDGGRNAIVPNFYWVTEINDKTKFGVGVNTQFGLATKYNDDWIGRYHAVESDVKSVNFNPSISYKVDDSLSLGFGIDVQYMDVILSSAIDFGSICLASFGSATCSSLGALPQQADGFARLTADNWAYGWNMGMLYQFSDATRVGVAYRSEIKQEVNGRADFTVPGSVKSFIDASGAFQDTGLRGKLNLPQSLSVSVYHDYDSDLAFLADVTWTGWDSFAELRINYDNPLQPDSVTTEEWNNTFRYSAGVNYRMDAKLMLRGGLAYDETPIPNAKRRTPRVPGDNRTWLSFGGQYIWDENITIDVGYSHLFVNKTNINNTIESSVPTLAATVNGKYDASVDILSAQATWRF